MARRKSVVKKKHKRKPTCRKKVKRKKIKKAPINLVQLDNLLAKSVRTGKKKKRIQKGEGIFSVLLPILGSALSGVIGGIGGK